MSDLYDLPNGWEWKKLGDISDFQGGSQPPKKEFIYEEKEGYVRFLQIRDFSSDKNITYIPIAKKNRLCEEDDILIGRYGASVGKILTGKKGAYNVAIMKTFPNEEIVTKRFFYMYLISPHFQNPLLNDVSQRAAQNGFSKDDISPLEVPLPPLSEQQRIVSKLDNLFEKIDKSIALHQKNMDEADLFMGSVLNDVFGELEEKYKGIPLFDVAEVNRGKSKHRPRNDKKLFGGNYPFIQTGDVRNATKYINSYSETYSEFGLSQSKLWKKGTICMTIAANIGDVAILDMDSCFPDSVVGLYSENNSNDFLYYFLLTLKQHLESKATTTAQMNINLKVLQTINIPLPPLPIQQKVVKYLDEVSEKIEKVKSIQKEKMDSLKALKASILDGAFRGEL